MRFLCKWTHESYRLTLDSRNYEEDFAALPESVEPIHCGLNDWAAIQAVIMPDADYSLSLDGLAAFSVRDGASLRAQFRVYKSDSRFRFTQMPETLPCHVYGLGFVPDDDGTPKADIVLSQGAVELRAGEPCALFLVVDVPRDTHVGVYTGELKLFSSTRFSDETPLQTLTFEINVHTVALSKPPDRSMHLDLWQHFSNIARKHETPRFSETHFAVIDSYAESLAALGQKAVTIIAADAPWAGQRCADYTDYPSDMYEYSMVKTVKHYDGSWTYDFTAIERIVAIFHHHDISEEIEVFGLIGNWDDPVHGFTGIVDGLEDSIRVRYLDEKDGCYKYMNCESDVRAYVYALYEYFVRTDLIDKVRVVADEPSDVGRFKRQLEWLRRLCPRLRYKCAVNRAEFASEFYGEIEDFVFSFECVRDKYEDIRRVLEDDKGRNSWYVCCTPPYPNTFIGSPLCDGRVIGLITAALGLDGFTRWSYTAWPDRPREKIKFGAWPAGDTGLVYPGTNGTPLLSLRYFALKRGLDEYEYAKMLCETVGIDEVRKQIFDAMGISGISDIKETPGYSLDPKVYDGIRRDMILALSQG